MATGRIPVDDLQGGMDLGLTLESGQTYCWRRTDGRAYATDEVSSATREASPWYRTVVGVGDGGGVARRDPSDLAALRVRQHDGALEWASTGDGEHLLTGLLRLEDDLTAVERAAPSEPLVREAFGAARGLRLVRDPPFPTLISFICSPQMRVGRIHEMVTALVETYGEPVDFEGHTYRAFPTPERLARVEEAELRELGLGYRAPYVRETAAMVADGELHPADAAGRPYEAARETLTEFVGVGEKVADCVLLFALGYLEAVPLDTWIRTAIAEHFPDCDREDYAATSRAIRERLGGDLAGYVQTYVFHHLRTR